jgi:hypothetical protein
MSGLARGVDRMVDFRYGSSRIPEQPLCQRPQGQGCHADIMAKVRRERTMLGGLVKR